MRQGGPVLLLLALAGCAVAPPPREPDPVAVGYRKDGQVALPDAAQAASCVSQLLPNSIVEMRRDGAAVRPAPGTVQPGGRPDYALVLERQDNGALAWHLLVGATGPEAAAVAQDLNRALGDCTARMGGVR
ncbi:hypothetical protein [Roseicella aquatilis]|uniref:Lipoprotein n=1 Tax=Roseicella aquatilis TaxID=2527868 RepID=A0A4R4D625_9PROT|nr:hypothetical protein [Roseicella aquatilis]TCZ55425.1 hypothetical protein EXY23_21675 [Roseicella aquatilis]